MQGRLGGSLEWTAKLRQHLPLLPHRLCGSHHGRMDRPAVQGLFGARGPNDGRWLKNNNWLEIDRCLKGGRLIKFYYCWALGSLMFVIGNDIFGWLIDWLDFLKKRNFSTTQ